MLPILPYYLSILGRRIDEFMIFPGESALCEMLRASFRISSGVAKSTSYVDDNYSTSVSNDELTKNKLNINL